MADIKKLLEDADPLRGGALLSSSEVRVMRTAMLEAAVTAPPSVGSAWHRPLAVATVVIVLIGLGGITGDRSLKPAGNGPTASDPASDGTPTERRQIQFATPGGTRIIWVLDPGFSLQDSLQETKP